LPSCHTRLPQGKTVPPDGYGVVAGHLYHCYGATMQLGNNPHSTLRALTIYLLLRYRVISPEGMMTDDGVWVASQRNTAICCAKVRKSDGANPFRLLRHCRTSEHVFHLFNLSCSLVEFRQLCKHSSQMYLSYLAVSELSPALKRLAKTVATDSCLMVAPHLAVEAVLLE
jgi:hypothetical protein